MQNAWFVLQFSQRAQLPFHILPVDSSPVSEGHAFGVAQIQRPKREEFHHQEILRGTGAQGHSRAERKVRRAADRKFFKRERSEYHVDPHSFRSLKQQHAMPAGKRDGVRDARGVLGDQSMDEPGLVSHVYRWRSWKIPAGSPFDVLQAADVC